MKDICVAWFVGVILCLGTPAWSAEPNAADPASDQRVAAVKCLGRAVMSKSPTVVLRQMPNADAPVAAVSPVGVWLHVERVEGDWLIGNLGCVRAAEVVLDDEAVEFFTRQLETAKTAFAYLCRSRGWILKQELDKALADAGEAALLEPQNARVFFAQARVAQAQERYDDELSAYERALALDPRDAMVLKARGELWSKVRPDPDKAIGDFTSAIDILPLHSGLRGWRGWNWLQKGDDDKALDDFNEAIRLDSKDAFTFASRAALHYRRQEYAAALSDADRAVVLAPKYAYGLAMRGSARLALQQFSGALEDLDEAIRLGASDAATIANRAFVHFSMRSLDAAIADLTQAISLDNDDPRLYQLRAEAWRLKGDRASAIIDLTEYLRLRPDNVEAYFERALILADDEQVDKALGDFNEIIRLAPGDALAYVGRALCQAELGQLELAADDIATAVRLGPHLAEAWQARAYVKTARREYREAVDDLSKALDLADKPSQAPIQSDLAWLLATCPDEKIRDGKRAMELARAAIAKLPHDADVCETLAAAFAETGDFTRAVYWQTKTMEQNNHESERAELEKRLALFQNKQPYRQDGVNAGRSGAKALSRPR